MALDKVVLQGNQVLLTEISSSSSIIELYGSNYLYGTIDKVSDICDNYSVGDLVIYNNSGSTSIIVEGNPYSLITEDKIQLKELP